MKTPNLFMQKITLYSTLFLFVVVTCMACSKSSNSPANPCAGVTITVTGTPTNTTTGSNGSISASATGSSGLTYSINGGAFQSSGTFSNLAAGTYTVTARNADGCTGTQQFTVSTTNICTGVTITASAVGTTAVPCGGAGGSITVTASGSTGLTYSLSGGAFQTSNIFANQAAGNYVVTVKDVNGCTQTANTTVAAAAAGPQFLAVKTIVQNNCAISGCHNATSVAGGINFTIDCNIVSNGARIKVRAVDLAGTPSQMPQPPNAALSGTQQQQITSWITGGGRFDN